MEQHELDLIAKYSDRDTELKVLWEEHQFYEKQLEKLEKKPYRSPDEERVIKTVKKKKLAGKTKMQTILDRYMKMED